MSVLPFSKLIRIVQAADALETYLGKHTGDNADWPIEILADNTQDAEVLAGLLSELTLSLKSYRAMKTPLDNPSLPPQSPSA